MAEENSTQGEVVEEFSVKHVKNAPVLPRKTYVVNEQAAREATEEFAGSEGIFKNGKVYKPGDEIELDEATAERFKSLGEIKDV